MSAWSALSAGTRTLILTVGGLAVVGVGYVGWQISQPSKVPDPAVSTVAELTAPPPEAETAVIAKTETAPEPVVAPQAVATPKTSAVPEAEAAPDAVPASALPTEDLSDNPAALPAAPPSFDTWRVEPGGDAVVSGQAAPGSRVVVLVDGAPVAEVDASPSGEFAALFTLPPNDNASLMTLTMTPPVGPEVISDEMVALGAITGPDVVAAAPVPAEPDVGPVVLAPDVAEATAPPAILLTGEGAVVLQEETLPDPALAAAVSIDTISYTPDGAVQLGGRGTGGATVRIYLDNSLQQSAPISAEGQWLATLGDTPPGIYTLRVDQLDAASKVTSRFETPFKRETLEALAAVADTAEEPVATPPAATALPPATDDLADQTAEPAPTVDEPAVPAEPTATDVATDPVPAAVEPTEPEPAASADLTPQPAPDALAAVVAEPAKVQPVTITVQPGFTLWGIAQAQMGDGVMYVQVFEANRDKIKDPDLIYPGQVFAVPEGDGG